MASAHFIRRKAAFKRYQHKLRLGVIDHYSHGSRACACCGERRLDLLQVDHVVPFSPGTRTVSDAGMALIYRLWRNKFPVGFQILCARCNSSKRNTGACRIRHWQPNRKWLRFGEAPKKGPKNAVLEPLKTH